MKAGLSAAYHLERGRKTELYELHYTLQRDG